jgi:hypothetical protein
MDDIGSHSPGRRRLPDEPRLYNLQPIDAQSGSHQVELYLGDVTLIPADILLISTMTGDYDPRPMTVLGSLSDNFDARISEDKLVELVPNQVLLAPRIPGAPFQTALIAHLRPTDTPPSPKTFFRMLGGLEQALDILMNQGVAPDTLSLPLLGAGNQGHPHHFVLDQLLRWIRSYLPRSRIRTVRIALYTLDALEACNKVFLDTFHRERKTLLEGADERHRQVLAALRNELAEIGASSNPLRTHGRRMADLLVQGRNVENSTIAAEARKFAEAYCTYLLKDTSVAPEMGLNEMVCRLEGHLRPPIWHVNYLHLLRVVGNSAVHERHREQFARIGDQDMLIVLFAVVRLLRTLDPKRES